MKGVFLSVVLIFMLAGNAQESEAQENGGLRLVDVQPIADLPGISDVRHALISPDGSQLAWINGDAAICVYQFDDETQHCFEQEDGRLTNLYWSPDSTRLAAHEPITYGDDPDIWVMNLQEEKLSNLTEDNITNYLSESAQLDDTVVWSGDDLIFARLNSDEKTITLQRINADGSNLTQLADITAMHEDLFFVRDTTLSPDGMQLALISYEYEPETHNLWIVDLISGEFKHLAHQQDITTQGVPNWYLDSDITSGDMLMWVVWTADGNAVIVGTDNVVYFTKSLINTFKIDVETTTVEPFLDWTAVEDDRAIYLNTSIYGYTPLLDRQLLSVWLADVNALVYFSSDSEYSGFSAITPGQEPVRLLLEDAGTLEPVYNRFMPNSVGYGDGVARVAING